MPEKFLHTNYILHIFFYRVIDPFDGATIYNPSLWIQVILENLIPRNMVKDLKQSAFGLPIYECYIQNQRALAERKEGAN